MASIFMSESTASACACTISGATGAIDTTPIVFCAVMAVITDVAYTPRAENVLMSACMPAPPQLSEPAIVIAVG